MLDAALLQLILMMALPVQFAVGSLLALGMWTLNLHEKPKVDKDLVGCLSRICSALTINVPVRAASRNSDTLQEQGWRTLHVEVRRFPFACCQLARKSCCIPQAL